MTTSRQKKVARKKASEWSFRTPRIDLTKEPPFGKLTVIGYYGSKNHSTYWTCKCECGTEKVIRYSHLSNNQITSCGCAKPIGSEHHRWNGYEEITGTYLHHLKTGAIVRGIEWDVSPKEMWSKFIEQNRRCALSGQDVSCSDPQTASLDRIDSDVGYIVHNIQWVHKDINRIKQHFKEPYFFEMCRMICEHQKGVK